MYGKRMLSLFAVIHGVSDVFLALVFVPEATCDREIDANIEHSGP